MQFYCFQGGQTETAAAHSITDTTTQHPQRPTGSQREKVSVETITSK